MTGLAITDHSIIRWLERGRGFDMGFFKEVLAGRIGRAPADHELLDWLNNEHGIDIHSMQSLLYQKALPAALLGVNFCPTDEGVLVFDHNANMRHLVTVITNEMYQEHRKRVRQDRYLRGKAKR